MTQQKFKAGRRPLVRKPRRKVRGRATPIDAHVGQRLRELRTMAGWSQSTLGDALNLTFQQVQKYERGSNRISSGRLWEIANMFGVEVGAFYEGLKPGPQVIELEAGLFNRRESLELLRNYWKVPDKVRKRCYGLIKAAARTQEAGHGS